MDYYLLLQKASKANEAALASVTIALMCVNNKGRGLNGCGLHAQQVAIA
mgnify:FL=1